MCLSGNYKYIKDKVINYNNKLITKRSLPKDSTDGFVAAMESGPILRAGKRMPGTSAPS